MASRTRAAGVCVWSGLAIVLLLAGCAGTSPPSSTDPTASLLTRGLDDVGKYYVWPVSDRQLVLAAAAGLTRLDKKVLVSEMPGSGAHAEIALEHNFRQIALYPEPNADDARGWGRLAGQIVTRVKAVSPRLAALPEERIDTALLQGMTRALDRFSRYSSPLQAKEDRAMRDGFGGIGVRVADSGSRFVITEVAPHGPAGRAGIRAGERIVAVDGHSVANQPLDAVARELLGPIGSSVEVSVAGPGEADPRSFSLERARIFEPTVSVTESGGILILRIASFNADTAQSVATKLKAARREMGSRLKGIVLDLRGDPGGLLTQAIDLADLFIEKGPIAATIGRNPAARQYFAAHGDSIAPHLPLVVLVNGYSASAAEIVASSLQDLGRAVVVGSASYGKGTVQTVVRLPNGGALTLTWAYLLTPSGYILHHHGVVPTVCTDGLALDGRPLTAALERVEAAAAKSPIVSRPRAALDERGWAELRAACPGRRRLRRVDLKIAERLLLNPSLYQMAMQLIEPKSRLASNAPSVTQPPAAQRPRLTPAAQSLSSALK